MNEGYMNKKHLLAELSKADYITIAATSLVLNAIWLLWLGHTKLAMAIGFVSMYCDYLDGWFARKYGGSAYGKVLDSLYDILGWVLFPSLVINIQTGWAWWSVIITTLFCLSGLIRLSRFTVQGYVETDKRYYIGLPVSYSRYALLLVFLIGAKLSVLILALMIPLMVSSRLFRKSLPFLMQMNLLYAAVFLWLSVKHV